MLTPSINDSLPSKLLFIAFKWLDGNRVFKIRVVCKQWLEIIDENKALWQVLVLGGEVEWNESVLDLFDGKSGSTLKEVSLKVESEDDMNVNHFTTALLRSNGSLLSFSLVVIYWNGGLHEKLEQLGKKVLPSCRNLVDFRATDTVYLPKVRLLRKTGIGKLIEDGISPLQVLWMPSIPTLLQRQPVIFQDLVFLAVPYNGMGHSEWREILNHSAGTLKHLYIAPRGESDGVAPLQ